VSETDLFDVIVVGGGPAGLSASLYLARYDRRVLLLDGGEGRSSWHQINHNYLGFPGGIAARELRRLGREQVAAYEQVTVREAWVEAMSRDGAIFTAHTAAGPANGRAVILCPGVVDHFPEFPGWEEYVGRSMFWCITCDGYGCKEARVVVVGETDEAAELALQLQRFTHQLTLLTGSERCAITPTCLKRLARAGIPLIQDSIAEVRGRDGQFEALRTAGGRWIELDQLFSHRPATPQTGLAADLGVELSGRGYILVDTEQKTNIAGVFAAGDATRLHAHQISTAVHEGGQAASAANYYLYPPEMTSEEDCEDADMERRE
jgi:thioredoxin reductase (NADPH)